MIEFGIKIKELRKEKGLNQSDLAKILNVRNTTISSWETGVSEPSYDILKFYCKYFGVTADFLLGLEDEM
jgi:transcriptional regulator with XRE-family HTH domain